jgi:hypothetical protein
MYCLSKGEIVMLVLLDLSAAFDTIDHTILLERLKKQFGVEGTALNWFKSYISNRSQSVTINDTESDKSFLKYGVPQGSKLGPVLFNSYISPLSEIASRNNVTDEKYADDEQLILSFTPKYVNDQLDSVKKMENCIKEIRDHLSNNKLCNNGEKTELMLIGNNNSLKDLKINSISIENIEIKAVSEVKNLGVIFDKQMTMEKQINKMCQRAYMNIRNISRIRQSLDKEDTKTAVNALVTPHLDYGNGLLYGIPKKYVNKLQIAQNSAVRLIEKIRRDEHITPYRKELHWLPIPARIQYKILTTTWKSLNNQAPKYLQRLLKIRQSNYSQRTINECLLEIPIQRGSNNLVDRAFFCSAPKLWNTLPTQIRNKKSLESFKSSLKTFLFNKFYA